MGIQTIVLFSWEFFFFFFFFLISEKTYVLIKNKQNMRRMTNPHEIQTW